MVKGEVQFAVKTGNVVVEEVEKSYIMHPRVRYGGCRIKWLEDKRKVVYNVGTRENLKNAQMI